MLGERCTGQASAGWQAGWQAGCAVKQTPRDFASAFPLASFRFASNQKKVPILGLGAF